MSNVEERKTKSQHSFYIHYGKRLLDILISSFAILILSPILIVISVLEIIYHGRPILYSQDRPGLNEQIFRLYKFRSMTNAVDCSGQLLAGDKRITSFGRVLRRLSLDELPELFCILTGKMSIIGPRPLLPEYLPLYTEKHRRRHTVRPGLACVSLRPLKSWTWNDQFENDIWYIENMSLVTDIKMVFAVAKEAIVGSEYRVNDDRTAFSADYWKKTDV